MRAYVYKSMNEITNNKDIYVYLFCGVLLSSEWWSGVSMSVDVCDLLARRAFHWLPSPRRMPG